MKKQVTRLSVNQNGKIVGIIMGIASTIIAVPVIIITMLPSIMNSSEGDNPISILHFILIPIMYLVIGYITTVVACSLYNVLYKHIGGFVYETEDIELKEEVLLVHIPEEDIS